MENKIRSVFKESIRVKEKTSREQVEVIVEITRLIIGSLKNGGKVLLCGNGGSAADCQHIACEFIGRFKKDKKPLPAIALSTDTSVLTSLANDYSYELVFAKQLSGLGKKDDILIAISTSGMAPNIIKAVKTAKDLGLKTAAFTGKDGGKLAALADIAFIVPSHDTPRIQETHITAAHAICEIAEEALYKIDTT
ncbi:MAG: D-sedoheptulose 7-phosphate isomerase [Candidatus Omnitrophota bacterium]|nr:D-sedoheptulose 7-phosphate isomerase [Candidatus Omnitrophota bacterium]